MHPLTELVPSCTCVIFSGKKIQEKNEISSVKTKKNPNTTRKENRKGHALFLYLFCIV